MGLFIRLMRWEMLTTITPTNVEMNVLSRIGIKISVGCAAPIWARYTMIEIGISISPEVLITRNMIIGLLAVSFFGFSSCNSFIALSPIGVAALSSPSILADIFIKIDPITGCPLGISGNRRQNTGLNQRDSALIRPLFSPIFMMPNHKERTPVNPRETSKAVLDELNVELMISVNICVSPVKINFPSATIKAMMKNAIQM